MKIAMFFRFMDANFSIRIDFLISVTPPRLYLIIQGIINMSNYREKRRL